MKTKPKNLKEFKELIERYDSIMLREIKEVFDEYGWDYTENVPSELTGFGSVEKCTLCKKGGGWDYTCKGCVYGINRNCWKGENEKTYNRIEFADTPLKLFNAYRARAKHMKTLI